MKKAISILFCFLSVVGIAASSGDKELVIEWQEVPGAVRYQFRITSGDGKSSLYDFKQDERKFKKRLPPGHYSYAVRTWDRFDRPSSWSQETAIEIAPSAPVALLPADGWRTPWESEDVRLEMKWKPSLGAQAHTLLITQGGEVYRSIRTDGDTSFVIFDKSGTFQWKVCGVIDRFKVPDARALRGECSVSRSFTIEPPPPPKELSGERDVEVEKQEETVHQIQDLHEWPFRDRITFSPFFTTFHYSEANALNNLASNSDGNASGVSLDYRHFFNENWLFRGSAELTVYHLSAQSVLTEKAIADAGYRVALDSDSRWSLTGHLGFALNKLFELSRSPNQGSPTSPFIDSVTTLGPRFELKLDYLFRPKLQLFGSLFTSVPVMILNLPTASAAAISFANFGLSLGVSFVLNPDWIATGSIGWQQQGADYSQSGQKDSIRQTGISANIGIGTLF